MELLCFGMCRVIYIFEVELTKVSSTQPCFTSNPIISKCENPLLMVDWDDVLVDSFWGCCACVWCFLIHPFDEMECDLQVWEFGFDAVQGGGWGWEGPDY